MSEIKLYAVKANVGEYSERREWICAIFDDLEMALKYTKEHIEKAKEDYSLQQAWLNKNWNMRKDWGRANRKMGWDMPKELIEEKTGPFPKYEADDFTIVTVILNKWGKYDELF